MPATIFNKFPEGAEFCDALQIYFTAVIINTTSTAENPFILQNLCN